MSLLSSKRGVSPLIATLLLILFAIALGVVVMNIGGEYIQGQGTAVASSICQSLNLKVISAGGQLQLCFDEEKKDIEFLIENGQTSDISAFEVKVIGSQTGTPTTLRSNQNVPKGQQGFVEVPYDVDAFGDIKLISLSPVLPNGESCTIENLQFASPRSC